MTGQSLLDRMELINYELQLQTGEEDVTRGLVALNVAQDYFETLAALRGKIFGGSTGTITTSASIETTAYPTGLMRLDRLVLLGDSSLPVRELRKLQRAGGHSGNSAWFQNLISTIGTGLPHSYWTDGTNIYWQPLPSGTSTIRYYGFKAASDITAAGTFAYPDAVAMPLATYAVRLMKTGVDDQPTDHAALGQELFSAVLDQLALFNRDGAVGLEYTQYHQE